ncbi:hypothetical protein MesoLj113c_49850 [Mesorhizobium sp. 113-3-9]|nr:hypothetical protein MesoLj113c_49850 [Mesorhizobium sp. 113-3-9]
MDIDTGKSLDGDLGFRPKPLGADAGRSDQIDDDCRQQHEADNAGEHARKDAKAAADRRLTERRDAARGRQSPQVGDFIPPEPDLLVLRLLLIHAIFRCTNSLVDESPLDTISVWLRA